MIASRLADRANSCYDAGVGGASDLADALTEDARTRAMADKSIPHSRAPRNDLRADYVQSILDYEPGTGDFRWRSRPREQFKSWHEYCRWNTRYAGTLAGSLNGDGYRCIMIDGRDYKAHRIACLYVSGEWPVAQIDHVNERKADNRFVNLRKATASENKRNSKRHVDNTSGFKGVGWHKQRGKWRAQIMLCGCCHHLGYFVTPEAAHAAYCEASARLHGEFGRVK
jgi:hypothetical protein